MMRSMYSGVAGLKTHQTKMDVIGNNIANVNTVAYKSQSVTFSELMYQTTQSASGANPNTGTAGTNARQIGLGVKTGTINASTSTQGASQTTNNPFDIRITGDSFFIVSDGANNLFTRDGSFYVDGVGNLAMTSNGYNVMGWLVDPSTNDIKQDTVKPLRIMSNDNLTYPPEETTKASVAGIIDKNDKSLTSTSGKIMNFLFYDKLGYTYTAKFGIHESQVEGEYLVELDDVVDSDNVSIVDKLGLTSIDDVLSFGNSGVSTKTELIKLPTGIDYKEKTPGAGDYEYSKKVVDFKEIFSDYEKTKAQGVTYKIPSSVTDGQVFAPGSQISLEGDAKFSKSILTTEPYNLIFDKDTGKYYTKDSYDKKDGQYVETEADWEAVFSGAGIKLDIADGTTPSVDPTTGEVKFAVAEQKFTVGDNEVTYNASEGSFKMILTQGQAYGIDTNNPDIRYNFDVAPNGDAQVTSTVAYSGNVLKFNEDTGRFISIGGGNTAMIDFKESATNKSGQTVSLFNFADIEIDFTSTTMFNNSGTSTISATTGDKDNLGKGRKLGEMSGISIQSDGRIYAAYDNGMSKLLGQIAVAQFANTSGLTKEGDNLYKDSQNSGEFNGIGVEVSNGGGYMTTGVLEMSNVDLSSEFTEMITTQRGFQANSRIISVSDSLLEELVNLKR